MTYNKREQRQQKATQRRLDDREAFRRRTVSARLKPFDWSAEGLGIRRADIDVFKAAATGFNQIILVRQTNVESLCYIGEKNFYPKPIDCKAKTAKRNVAIAFGSRYIHSRTAGLVADPTLVGAKAFDDYDDALHCWQDFLKDKTPSEIADKVYRRRGTNFGCYAVDTDLASPFYGCLMISRSKTIERTEIDGQKIGSTEGEKGFDETAAQATAQWRNAVIDRDQSTREPVVRMQYLHGDYDLYALFDADDPPNDKTDTEWINGVENKFGALFPSVQEFINNGIGAPMIQHGGQFRMKHKADTIYVFYPRGAVYVISELDPTSVEEIFEVLYGFE